MISILAAILYLASLGAIVVVAGASWLDGIPSRVGGAEIGLLILIAASCGLVFDRWSSER